MPGIGNISSGVFPYRSTSVVFNDYGPSVTQPWIAIQRSADDMCHGRAAALTNAVFLPGVGFQNRSYQLDWGDAAWFSAAASGNLSLGSGNIAVAPNHFEDNSFFQQTITGVTYAGGVQSQGNPFIVARPAAGTDWSTNVLSGDQSAFPSPNIAEDSVSMDRVLVTNAGVVQPWDALTFQVYAPASVLLPRGTFATFYFNGPPGTDFQGAANSQLMGQGQYALKLRSDGRAYLYEMLVNQTWQPRFSFMWNFSMSPIYTTLITISIVPHMWIDQNGAYQGDRITFLATNQSSSPGQYSVIQALVDVAQQRLRMMNREIPVYNVPNVPSQQAVISTIVPTQVRIDIARDCRASFRVAHHVYYPTATIQDDYVSMGQPLTTDQNLYVYWHGSLPSGTGWSLVVYDQAGNALAPATGITTTNGPDGQTSYQSFVPTTRMTYAQAAYTLNASGDSLHCPTLAGYAFYRSPTYSSTNPLALVTVPARGTPPSLYSQSIASVSISPQETDPGAENASLIIDDLTGGIDFLESRHMPPVSILTTYDAGQVNKSSLFRGYGMNVHGERMRNDGRFPWPNQLWTRWHVDCVGEWARFAEAIVQRRYKWTQPTGSAAGQPFKVTDILRTLAQTVYPASMVDVPDSPIQLFTEDTGAYVTEPGTRVADQCQDLATDYFGGYWLFDQSAGTRGVMRMKMQITAPYNNLAIFELAHPTTLAGDNLPRIPQWCAAYGTTTLSNRQIVQHLPIQGGTLDVQRERSEGNLVTVYGGAVDTDAAIAGSQDAALLTNFAIKVDSFNFLNLAPNAPGYPNGSSPEFYDRIVPIHAEDFKLGTQQAVDWKVRRIYEKACFSRFYMRFSAPLILVTDVTDSLQTSPRRLRFYDPVQVRQQDGTLSQFLVVHCAPSYKRDGVQMADYLLVTQSNINTIGVIDRQSSTLKALMKGLGRLSGIDPSRAPQYWSSQKQSNSVASQIMGLPQPTGNALQDLNNTSSTFGQFYFMQNFSKMNGPDLWR